MKLLENCIQTVLINKYFPILGWMFIVTLAVQSCSQKNYPANVLEAASITVLLSDTILAKPPSGEDYEIWVERYPKMAAQFMLVGTVGESMENGFSIAIRDKNKNGIYDEYTMDYIYLAEYKSDYVEWSNYCSNVTQVKENMIFEYFGKTFQLEMVDPGGAFLKIKPIVAEGKSKIELRKSDRLPLSNEYFEIKQGESATLSEHLNNDGKKNYVFVNFWAPWCAPCIEEIPQLIKLSEKNVTIINVCDEFSKDSALETINIQGIPGLQIIGNEVVHSSFDFCGRGYPYGILYHKGKEIRRNLGPSQAIKIVN